MVTHSVCSAARVCQVPPGLEAAEGTEISPCLEGAPGHTGRCVLFIIIQLVRALVRRHAERALSLFY